MALTDKLTAIADAVRSKTGGTKPLTLDQMAVEIENISAGGGDMDALIDKSITEITSNVTIIGDSAFRNCDALTTVNFPNVTFLGDNAFFGCDALTTLAFPNVTTIRSSVFSSCIALKAVIFRNTENISTLNYTNAFNSTPIKNGNGYIYVPRALVEEYKSATNWSTLASQFRALEDYTVDGTITGALDETKI